MDVEIESRPETGRPSVDRGDPVWYLAYGIEERLRAGPPNGSVDLARGERRLKTWQSEPIFAEQPELLAERLGDLGIDEEGLAELLGESAETVGSRFREEPEWAAVLARAFQTPAASPVAASDGHDHGHDGHDHDGHDHDGHGHGGQDIPHQFGFTALAEPLFRDAMAQIRAAVERLTTARPSRHVDPAVLAAQLTQVPMVGVVQLVARTAVLELNVLRIQDELPGDTPEERFGNFVRRLGEPGYALELLREYPLLARNLVRLAENWRRTRTEFAERLVADIETIASQFPDPAALGTLSAIQFGAGDTHREGRSVGIVQFDSGEKIVYKPRRLAVDRHFHELLDWLNERGQQPRLRSFWIVDGGEYGWTEFVTAAGCPDRAALGRFYTRQGAYVALLHALAATDFHFENLIAAGEYPVLVDLEALFHPWQWKAPASIDVPEDAFALMRGSVLSVGLLPNPIVWHDEDEIGHVDLSGLAGAAGQLSPTAVPTWDGGGTDLMHLVRRRVEVAGAANLPSLEGTEVRVLDFRAELVAGFQSMYQLLREHRDALLAPDGPLAAFAADEIRVIVRPTRTYMLLMLESYHPDLLRDALDRDRFFDNLWSGHEGVSGRRQIVAAELAQLRHGDVPIFSTTPGSRDMVPGDGSAVISEALSRSGMERALERMAELSDEDLQRQTWFIEASLAALAIGVEKDGDVWSPAYADSAPPPPSTDYLAAACRVGDRLVTLALGDETISWLGLNFVSERLWLLNPAGMDMYNGISGIALFLGYLGEVTGDDSYRAAAERAGRVATRQIELVADLPADSFQSTSVGVFTGLGAPLYTLAHLDALWGRQDFATAAENLLTRLGEMADDDQTLDVIGGCAGGIFAALALHAVRPDGMALEHAERMARRLLDTSQESATGLGWRSGISPDVALAGFSHGASGVATALARLDLARGERRLVDTVRAAVRYERSVYDPEIGNWRDLRSIAPEGVHMVAWCHGAGGIGLARADLADYLDGDPLVAEDLRLAADAVLREGFGVGNHSICHGDLGNVEALLAVADRLGDTETRERALRAAADATARIGQGGWLSGVPLGVETPGLMPGLAGMGYNLLRLAAPDQVPSVLLVEPPRPGSRS